MRKLDIDISEIKKLVELVENYHLEELTVEEGDLSITVKGRSPQGSASVVVHSAPGAPHAEYHPIHEHEEEVVAEELEIEQEEELEGNIVDITAPLVGVFYRAPAPDAPNFVEVGDAVEIGSELGLIEAMKVFSPIPSEVAGVIVDIPGDNGKLVKQGDILFRIRVSEE